MEYLLKKTVHEVAKRIGQIPVPPEIMKTIELLLKKSEEAGFPIEKVQHRLLEFVELVFGFHRFYQQLLLIMSLQLAITSAQSLVQLATRIARSLSKKGKKIRGLHHAMTTAASYRQWLQTAEELDTLLGNDKWRQEAESSLYDHTVLRKRISDIQGFLRDKNMFSLIFRLRGGLSREQFGMQHEGLFSRAHAGTKAVVEEYHATVCHALDHICDTVDDQVPTDAKLAFFNEARHSYGRTALLV